MDGDGGIAGFWVQSRAMYCQPASTTEKHPITRLATARAGICTSIDTMGDQGQAAPREKLDVPSTSKLGKPPMAPLALLPFANCG